MFLRRVAPLIAVLSCIMPLTACEESTGSTSFAPRSGVVDPEAYGALPWTFPVVNEIRVANEFGGDIIITEHDVSLSKEVALDYNAINIGTDPVRAAAEARRAVNVTMNYDGTIGRVVIWAAGTAQQPPQSGQSVRLHVRVPRGVNLDLTTRAGRITVSGVVGNVLASATDRIEVRGAVGDLMLVTSGGGIMADGANARRIEARSQNGNITIFSTDASVTAAVTGTGGIEFVGTLTGQGSSFLTYTGPITVALPEDLTYNFKVSAPAGRVLTDFRPGKGGNPAEARPVCGIVTNGASYDYHVRYLDDIYSHLDVTFANVGNYLTGTLGADVYYFFTDRSDLTFYTPLPQAIHIFANDGREAVDVNRPGQPLGTTECNTPPPSGQIGFTANTQSGLIFLHHILMRRQ